MYRRCRIQLCEPGLFLAGEEFLELAVQPNEYPDQDLQLALEVIGVAQKSQSLAQPHSLTIHRFVRTCISQVCCDHVLFNLAQLAVHGYLDCVTLEMTPVENTMLAEQQQVGAEARQKDLPHSDLKPQRRQKLGGVRPLPAG